jgi:hypothetical protein
MFVSVFSVLAGCGGVEDEDDGTVEPTAVKSHTFVIQAKNFIAHINDNEIGSTGNGVDDVKLIPLWEATNAAYSENPTDPGRASGQFRIWASVHVNFQCSGRRVQNITVTNLQTDAGQEGPLQGVTFPIQTRIVPNANIVRILAHGHPPDVLEPVFQAVHPRTHRDIWYHLMPTVGCDANGNANIWLNANNVAASQFPSLRVWVTSITNGHNDYANRLLINWHQSFFSTLWMLPSVPPP